MEGAPENGDVVIFSPEARPSRTFELLVKDGARVAVSAAMRSAPGASNVTSTEVTLATIAEEDQPKGFEFGYALNNVGTTTSRRDVTISADGMRPAVQVGKGTEGAQVLFDIKADGDQQIQILTREGVHLAGTASISVAEANTLMSVDSGFGDGGYSSTYLNQSGSAAYLDSGIRFGAIGKAEEIKQLSVDPDTGVKSEVTVQSLAQFGSKPLHLPAMCRESRQPWWLRAQLTLTTPIMIPVMRRPTPMALCKHPSRLKH
jgi:hypothetical protein